MKRLFKRRTRRFIPPKPPLEHFFAKLNAAGCRYAVLRWFEDFPHIAKGEDVDILVHDKDADLLRSFLLPSSLFPRISKTTAVKCDVYSVSGLARSAYRGVAYYPPHLARKILERAVDHPSGARAPCQEDHFYSLAFHALYHKGLRAGIPTADAALTPNARPEHDYAGRLRELAAGLGINVAMQMEALDAELAARGWRPPLDLLEKLSPRDPWRRARMEALLAQMPPRSGLAVFFVRERALEEPQGAGKISALLAEEGFSVLAVKPLSAPERERVAREVRGANWSRGPWPVSGGLPAAAIAAIDVYPHAPDRRLSRRHPEADNARVFCAKERIRARWNGERQRAERCNIIHSSDNCRQAAVYLDLAMPEFKERILQEADRSIEDMNLGGEVVHRFDRSGRRSIVELLRQSDGSLVVRKIFKPGNEAYLEREVQTINELRKISPDTVPQVLEHGKNYFIMPFYEDARVWLTKNFNPLLPIRALRKTFLSVQKFFEHGYVFADFRPHNVIIQNGNEVKIIDYEHVYNRSVDDVLKKNVFYGDNYNRVWMRKTALPLQSLLHDPLWLAYSKRWSVGYFLAAGAMIKKMAWKGHKRYKAHLEKKQRR